MPVDQGVAKLKYLLIDLYGYETGGDVYTRLQDKIHHYKKLHPIDLNIAGELTERNALLITYGDQVKEAGRMPLQSLAEFCTRYLQGVIDGIHILPFFPYSSDDGFSVIDYYQVDPALGTWNDIDRLAQDFHLMFDAVVNHISIQSEWFKQFLQGQPKYRDYFIEVEKHIDLSRVVRPRALPLLTEFDAANGKRSIWTTFSTDQVDLNYHNPEVLLDVLDVLLFYVEKGARYIRLDAIAFIWKEIGTTCIHLPQTHHIIQIMRLMLDEVAPYVKIITETNVPHRDNISYFGDGISEAHLVYNFALPPLVLHTMLTGNADTLSAWAEQLTSDLPGGTFFNFLASHDGIGLNPARGILSPDEIDSIIKNVLKAGGEVSYKQEPDGNHSPYELNVNYFDALNGAQPNVSQQYQVEKFVTAHAILCALCGVPGIYFHSLFGSRGWKEGVQLTGIKRTINRQKLERGKLEEELSLESSRRFQVYSRMASILKARAAYPEFNPYGGQGIISGNPAVFAVHRFLEEGKRSILCLHNVSDSPQPIAIDVSPHYHRPFMGIKEIISRQVVVLNKKAALTLKPYQTRWLLLEA
ncbi:MAG: hypothetical protein JW908_10065 [Anaerolineales bacterium]|nr:hypothetical protein [Anaerolineales bacterium]